MSALLKRKSTILLFGTALLSAVGIRFGISKYKSVQEEKKYQPPCAAEVGTPEAALPNVDEFKRSFHPEPAEFPRELGHFIRIPEGDGNAAEDLVEAMKLAVVALGPESFKKHRDFEPGDPRLDQAFKRIEDALGKPRNEMTGVIIAPSSRMEILAWIMLSTRLAMFYRRYQELYKRAMNEGRYQDARELGRKQLGYGWLLMQDWGKTEQSLGGTVAVGGLLDIQQASKAAHEWCRPDREASLRLAMELSAFAHQDEELEPINKYVDSPSDPSMLNRYLKDPALLSRYADYVMSLAATSKGTDHEKALAKQFLQTAALDRNPRVALLAKGYLKALDDHRQYTPAEAEDVESVLYQSSLQLLERGR